MPVSFNRGRRRRVVLDEAVQCEYDPQDSKHGLSRPSRDEVDVAPSYAEGARRKFQLRTTDLIPKRAFTLVAVISILMTALFGIVLLDGYAPKWIDSIGQQGVDAFTIGAPSSLAVWFSVFILILTSIGCLQIFVLRQHRRDDYRGVYRWWLWMAVILLLASLNNVVGIVEIAMTALGNLFQSPNGFTAGWGWLLVKFAVLLLLVGRFGFEMRVSRGAVIGCGIVFVTYCGALVLQASASVTEMASQSLLTYGNLMLFGKIAVFSVVLVYSRFIYLEAHGLVKINQTVKKEKSIKTKQPKAVRNSKVKKHEMPVAEPDVEPVKKRKPLATPLSKKSRRADQQTDYDSRSSDDRTRQTNKQNNQGNTDFDSQDIAEEIASLQGKDLSKSERRRLKKLQRRQNRAAA